MGSVCVAFVMPNDAFRNDLVLALQDDALHHDLILDVQDDATHQAINAVKTTEAQLSQAIFPKKTKIVQTSYIAFKWF